MPESKSPFRPSFLKIERAQQHIAELDKMAHEYLASEPVTVNVRRLDPNEATNLPPGMTAGWRFSMNTQPSPELMSAIIGDIFHNLRSSLDLMASALARLNEQSDDGVYFPFSGSESELDNMINRRHFDRAGPAAVRLLREMKPYKGGNKSLRAIHDLNIRDKHQELIVQRVQASVASPIIDLRPDDGGPPRPITEPVNKPAEVKLVFPNDCDLAGKELIQTLHHLVEVTTCIVKAFEALRAPTA
jgi:hypothetical protein